MNIRDDGAQDMATVLRSGTFTVGAWHGKVFSLELP